MGTYYSSTSCSSQDLLEEKHIEMGNKLLQGDFCLETPMNHRFPSSCWQQWGEQAGAPAWVAITVSVFSGLGYLPLGDNNPLQRV